MGGKTVGTWGMGLGAMEVEAARRREVLLADAGGDDRSILTKGDGFSARRILARFTERRAAGAERRPDQRPVGGCVTEV